MRYSALLTIGLLSLCPSCSKTTDTARNKSTLHSIIDRGVMRVGYLVYSPIVTRNPVNKDLGGHFVATIEALAADAGCKVEYVETDFANFAGAMRANKFDFSIVPTFATISRAKSVAFTRPLLYAGNSAVAPKGNKKLIDLASLRVKDLRIAVTQGEAGHEYAKNHLPEAELIVHPGPDQALTFQSVVAGRADVALGDAYAVASFVKANSKVVRDVFQDRPYNLTPVCWATRHGDQVLLNFLNTAIRTLEIQGKLKAFEKEAGATWLHEDVKWTVR